MSKAPKIANEVEKLNLLFYLTKGGFFSELTSEKRKCLRKKAKHFTVKNGNLFIVENAEEKRYVCEFEIHEIENIIKSFHLPGHIGKNLLRNHVKNKYAGITVKHINDYISICSNCIREEIPTPTAPLTPIVPSLIRERLMADTIDLSEYASENDGIRYVFTFIDSFSKFAFVFTSTNRDSNSVYKILKKLFFSEGPWKIFHTDNGGGGGGGGFKKKKKKK
ncbi:KRAB-A domain-containing protein 2 [Cucumispora dikerogammari]|nr:KRAB-A domain-containing protein 2 [Cucumispora dikerogammari]